MKNILKIYKRDLKNIFTNSMAIILVVGLAVLPSLYAWFNIYANWDPYGSTGNMMVAVVNDDEGFKYRDIKINVGEEIVSNLKGNDAIDWQFVSKDEALNGIESGKYYAGIEIPKGFSKSFASIMSPVFVQPKITYYANEKKNAIATKITDKVVQTVQTSVNESFVTTVIDLVNAMLGVVVEESDHTTSNAINSIQDQIKNAQDSLKATEQTLNSFKEVVELSNDLVGSLNPKNLDNLLTNTSTLLDGTEDVITVSSNAVGAVIGNIGVSLDDATVTLDNVANLIREKGNLNTQGAKRELLKASEQLENVKNILNDASDIIIKLNQSLPHPLEKVTAVAANIKALATDAGNLSKDIKDFVNGDISISPSTLATRVENLSKRIKSAKADFSKNVQPKLEKAVIDVLNEINSLSNIVDSLQANSSKISTLTTALNKSAKAGDTMVGSLMTLLTSAEGQLKSLSEKLTALQDSEILNTLTNMTSTNKDELGAFIACPVKIDTDKVYGIENYGSAMAPFYSTLAIWVGGMFLVAVMSPTVKKKKEIGRVTHHEAYFGRALTFLTISFVQGMVICLGDLLLFKIQCYHPAKFMIAGGLASLVYTLFIYSLTYTLGDLGKSVGVIMLVLQIGGSGGTFPIDVTPPLFRAINPYLPFTFVIEAMRECICGLYQNEYWIWLLKLCAYIPIALVIGLGLKLVVHKPLKFFEKRLEKTDLL